MKIREAQGHLFELAFNAGLLTAIHQSGMKYAHMGLFIEDLKRINHRTMIAKLVEMKLREGFIDEESQRIWAAWGKLLLLRGHLGGLGLWHELMDSFGYSRAADFAGQYDFEGIEPFTCLLFEAGEVLEFRWDGETGHLAEKDPEQAHFWCSATLYPPEMQALRRKVFENFLTGLDRAPDEKNAPENLFRLHLEGKVGDPENDFVMNRQGRVRTVSITQVIRRGEDFKMRYEDLLKEEDLLD